MSTSVADTEPTFMTGARNLAAVIEALMLREIWRHGRTKWTLLTFALLICEPVGVIIAFGCISALLLRLPPYGPSTILFHATGIIPFYYFIRVSARTRNFELDKVNRLPRVDPFDDFLILCIMDFVVMSFGTVIIFAGLAIFISPLAIPFNPLACIGALATVAVLACGISLINAAMINISRAWVTLTIVAVRGLMLFSGVIFVVDFMPSTVRYWLNLNPLSHAIMWFRTGIYPRYPAYSMDINYLLAWAFCAIIIGLLVERAMRDSEIVNDNA